MAFPADGALVTASPRVSPTAGSESLARQYGKSARSARISPLLSSQFSTKELCSAAHETDFSIHHDQFPVRTVVEPLEGMPPNRLIPLHFAAGFAQRTEIAVRRFYGADRVHDHSDLDARARSLDEYVEKLVGNSAAVEDVSLQMDASMRAPDRTQFLSIKIPTVRQNFDSAAPHYWHVHKRRNETQRLVRSARRKLSANLIGQPGLEQHEQQKCTEKSDCAQRDKMEDAQFHIRLHKNWRSLAGDIIPE